MEVAEAEADPSSIAPLLPLAGEGGRDGDVGRNPVSNDRLRLPLFLVYIQAKGGGGGGNGGKVIREGGCPPSPPAAL